MVVLLARKPLLMQQHCNTIGFGWGHCVFVGYVVIYWEKKYSEVHSEAVYVISLNHMQKLVKPTYFVSCCVLSGIPLSLAFFISTLIFGGAICCQCKVFCFRTGRHSASMWKVPVGPIVMVRCSIEIE